MTRWVVVVAVMVVFHADQVSRPSAAFSATSDTVFSSGSTIIVFPKLVASDDAFVTITIDDLAPWSAKAFLEQLPVLSVTSTLLSEAMQSAWQASKHVTVEAIWLGFGSRSIFREPLTQFQVSAHDTEAQESGVPEDP